MTNAELASELRKDIEAIHRVSFQYNGLVLVRHLEEAALRLENSSAPKDAEEMRAACLTATQVYRSGGEWSCSPSIKQTQDIIATRIKTIRLPVSEAVQP